MRKQNSSPPKRACSSWPARSVSPGRFLGNEVVRADLLAQQAGDAIDDLIAQRVAERVVVPLERGHIDQADGAPPPALLQRQERLQLLDEAAEVHQPRLRIAVDAIGEVGDQIFEVPGDAADRGVAGRQLLAHPIHALGEAGGYSLDRLLLRLLPEALVLHEDVVDGVEQRAAPAVRANAGGSRTH